MPKYVLDEKGILTITSEYDGGIFAFNDVLKKMTIILLVISIVSSIGLYGCFYNDAQTANVAIQYSIENVSSYDPSNQLTWIAGNNDWGYGFRKVYSRIERYPNYYQQSFEIMVARGQELISEIYYQIESFKHKWR